MRDWNQIMTCACSAPRHCLNKCWLVNWNLNNSRQWNFNKNATTLIKNVDIKMTFIQGSLMLVYPWRDNYTCSRLILICNAIFIQRGHRRSLPIIRKKWPQNKTGVVHRYQATVDNFTRDCVIPLVYMNFFTTNWDITEKKISYENHRDMKIKLLTF